MMLTTKQSVHYGYRALHDLPTPPRTSPTIANQDQYQQTRSTLSETHSPQVQSMSASHRGLPPPVGMALPQPSAPTHQAPPPGPPHHPSGIPASAHSHALVPPPPAQPHSEESSGAWLQAKVEEEKRRQEEERRRQEEERTRQENLRLEQRKLEFDMLRTSLDRGIPPQLVPIVFAAMGGGQLPQAFLEFAQPYLQAQSTQTMQSLPAPPASSPEHHREPQYATYASTSATAPPAAGSAGLQPGFIPYHGAGSPPRQRAHTLSSMGGPPRPIVGSGPLRLHTEEPASGNAPQGVPPLFRGGDSAQPAGGPQSEQSPSIYFHHWQPPASQTQSAQPDPPSESPRKRKATGPQPAPPPPSSQIRTRSPPFGHKHNASRHRGHSRQRSDMSSYRPSARARGDNYSYRGASPGFGPSRDGPAFESSQQQQPRSGAHLTSMLSDQLSPRFSAAEPRQQNPHQRPQQSQESHFPSQPPPKSESRDTPMQSTGDDRQNSLPAGTRAA